MWVKKPNPPTPFPYRAMLYLHLLNSLQDGEDRGEGEDGEVKKNLPFFIPNSFVSLKLNNEISSSPHTSNTSNTSHPAIFLRLMGKE